MPLTDVAPIMRQVDCAPLLPLLVVRTQSLEKGIASSEPNAMNGPLSGGGRSGILAIPYEILSALW
jgi:hypothetical protein